MEKSPQHTEEFGKEISPKEIILKVRDWISFLFGKWKVIFLSGLIAGGVGLALAFIVPKKYVAEVTFVVEDNSSNPLGAYMGLASQFGIDLGGGGNSGIFQGDNIMEFLKSRLMVETALMAEVNVEGRTMTLANLYIDFNELRSKWKEKPELANIQYPLGKDRKKYTLLEDSILNKMQTDLVETNLIIEKPDKKLSFIKVKCISESELFSKIFVEQLVHKALDFYVNTKTQRTKVNINRLQLQADSLKTLLDRKTFSAAVTQDLNTNPARQVASVGTELVMRDKMVLQTMYGEVVKNLELSKITMSQETPLIQIVDTPILPLEIVKLGKLKGSIIGGFIGVFLTILFLVVRRIYQSIMND